MNHKILDLILSAGIPAIVALLGYFGKRSLDTLNNLNRSVAKLDQHLFGPEGHNGLTGQVKDHEVRIETVERVTEAHDIRLGFIEERRA